MIILYTIMIEKYLLFVKIVYIKYYDSYFDSVIMRIIIRRIFIFYYSQYFAVTALLFYLERLCRLLFTSHFSL